MQPLRSNTTMGTASCDEILAALGSSYEPPRVDAITADQLASGCARIHAGTSVLSEDEELYDDYAL